MRSQRRLVTPQTGSAIPQDFLVSEWKLEETTGTTFYDSKGTNHGTSPTDTSNLTGIGVVGNWFNFEGYGACTVPANASLALSDGITNKKFSLSLWFDIIVPQSQNNVASYRNGGAKIWEFASYANIFKFFIHNTDGSFIELIFPTTGGSKIPIDLTHIVLSFDPTETAANKLKAYVNGFVNPNDTTGTLAIVRSDAASKFGFGGRVDVPSSINQSRAALDEVKYYVGKTLTQEEAIAIYNEEKP